MILQSYKRPLQIREICFHIDRIPSENSIFFRYIHDVTDEEGNPILLPTELRRDINYSIYFNWFRFVSLGIVPFALLVLFNAKIYVALRKRKQRRLIRQSQQGRGTEHISGHSKGN